MMTMMKPSEKQYGCVRLLSDAENPLRWCQEFWRRQFPAFLHPGRSPLILQRRSFDLSLALPQQMHSCDCRNEKEKDAEQSSEVRLEIAPHGGMAGVIAARPEDEHANAQEQAFV
mmetsp:Transcript_16260/g.37510  ORF Transcript_16260/g.37510 Transcript_16260/m.37510 type:complete len:115 (-) Transcript_16260:88-432(-)